MTKLSHFHFPATSDAKKRIIKIRILSEKDQKIEKNTEILIMAGGFGKRLLPLTKKILYFYNYSKYILMIDRYILS